MKFQMAKLIFNPGGVTPSVKLQGRLSGTCWLKGRKRGLNSMSGQKRVVKLIFFPWISEKGSKFCILFTGRPGEPITKTDWWNQCWHASVIVSRKIMRWNWLNACEGMPITGSNISPSKTCLRNPFYISAAKMSTILRTFCHRLSRKLLKWHWCWKG